MGEHSSHVKSAVREAAAGSRRSDGRQGRGGILPPGVASAQLLRDQGIDRPGAGAFEQEEEGGDQIEPSHLLIRKRRAAMGDADGDAHGCHDQERRGAGQQADGQQDR